MIAIATDFYIANMLQRMLSNFLIQFIAIVQTLYNSSHSSYCIHTLYELLSCFEMLSHWNDVNALHCGESLMCHNNVAIAIHAYVANYS